MNYKIGLFGLTFDSGNMGCCAMAYSFLGLLNKVMDEKDFVIYYFSENGYIKPRIMGNTREIIQVGYSWKNAKSILNLVNKIKDCDIIFDFTEGDSFSDIYGNRRMFRVSMTKMLAIICKKKLILGPQTFGPYNSFWAKQTAKWIVCNSKYVCTRDEQSASIIEELTRKSIDIFTDVAFALPFNSCKKKDGNIRIGINVSGLLWNGGYTGNNQFGLRMDYQLYIKKLIETFLEKEYEVYLIPHVITKNPDNPENDVTANKLLKQLYPKVNCAPEFTDPFSAKDYIANMDVLIASRMHATIGAFSSGVITIPVSYSRKFEGLYSGLGYRFLIHALQENTEEAYQKTLQYIENAEELKNAQLVSMEKVNDNLEAFTEKIKEILAQ